jgi:hypothetical protein
MATVCKQSTPFSPDILMDSTPSTPISHPQQAASDSNDFSMHNTTPQHVSNSPMDHSSILETPTEMTSPVKTPTSQNMQSLQNSPVAREQSQSMEQDPESSDDSMPSLFDPTALSGKDPNVLHDPRQYYTNLAQGKQIETPADAGAASPSESSTIKPTTAQQRLASNHGQFSRLLDRTPEERQREQERQKKESELRQRWNQIDKEAQIKIRKMLNSRSKESEDEIAIRADELKERRRFLRKNDITQQSDDWDLLLYGPLSETDRPRYDALNSTLVDKEDYLDQQVAAEKAAKASTSKKATQQTDQSPA